MSSTRSAGTTQGQRRFTSQGRTTRLTPVCASSAGMQRARRRLLLNLDEDAGIPGEAGGATQATATNTSDNDREPDGAEEYEDDFEEVESDDDSTSAAPTPPPAVAAAPCQSTEALLAEPGAAAPNDPPKGRGRSRLQGGGGSSAWTAISVSELDLLPRPIANGAMGAIHAGVWRGRKIAAKQLHDCTGDAAIALREEVEVHAALSHINIVELLGASLAPPHCCVVMELCTRSLFERVHGCREGLGRRLSLRLAAQVASGLAYLHSRAPPVVHRDIKSHNVLLCGDTTAKICDFGLVRSKEPTAGTPNYMPPETFLAQPGCGGVDVFALGILLNELFSSEVPWDGYEPMNIKAKVLRGERPPESKTMPVAAQTLVRTLWHQNVSQRPRAQAAATALAAIESALPQAG